MRRRYRRVPAERSSFAGFRFPPDVITLAVRWYLRYGLSYRDVEELPVERGITVDHVDFDLWCTAVSAINGCGACVDSHEKTLREKGLTEEKIIAAVRIASIVHAIASVLQAESALGNLSPVAAQTV